MRIQAASVFSAPGNRESQEDQVFLHQERGIFVVADGFGGPQPGASAAKTACDSIHGFLFKEAGDLEATLPFEIRPYFSLAGNVLFNAMVHANRKVLKLNNGKNVHEKGAASVLAGFVDGNLLALANVGGCSGLLFRGGLFTELVTPRTYARLRDPFAMDAADEFRAPLSAVGMNDGLEPEIFEYQLQSGDWLLMRTDGIPASLCATIAAIQQESASAETSAERILEVLNGQGYEDNATAMVVIFG